MKRIEDLTVTVVDNGLFVPVARELARQCRRVCYWSPWEEGFPTVNRGLIGDGFQDIERIDDVWMHVDETDLFVFPDIQHAGMQLQLERLGKPVWGSRRGDAVELERRRFLKMLNQAGLPVPKHQAVRGLKSLRAYLEPREHLFVKFSKFRGSMETWHWISADQSADHLDKLATTFGPLQDAITFLVFEAIDTDIEVGLDSYVVDGRCPQTVIQGYECKDRGYLGHAQPISQTPEPARVVQAAFVPLLAPFRYRNFFSTEIRVLDGEPFFIDPCCRAPIPGTASQLALYENLAEIFWHGAHGELIEPSLRAKYSAEVVLRTKNDPKYWTRVAWPEPIKDHVFASGTIGLKNLTCYPPTDKSETVVGWLVSIGDSPQDAVDTLRTLVEQLPPGIDAAMESLVELVNELEQARQEGIQFGPEPLPETDEILKSS